MKISNGVEITSAQKQKINELAKEFNLKLILLFGSRLSEKKFLHRESDFDIAYLSEGNLDLMAEGKLICDLMSIFKSDKIDLENLKKADPLLRHEVAKNCLLLYGKKEDFFEFKARAFKDYINHLPLLELEDFLIKRRQKLFAQTIYDK